jgi:hypothetical protein
MLAIVQFSSFAEDGRRGLPATRSLETEQRFGEGSSPRATESGRRFRITLGPKPESGLPGPPPRWRTWKLPRKEVIQPQLPLRLPCYDFTPITSPTFDGCLPKGLAHRLRVLPAFVV